MFSIPLSEFGQKVHFQKHWTIWTKKADKKKIYIFFIRFSSQIKIQYLMLV